MITNKEYHGVEIENYRLPQSIIDWLNTRVGRGKWFIKGHIEGQTIYFENEKDHFLFLMTWGQRG